jgi:hypothetical protein
MSALQVHGHRISDMKSYSEHMRKISEYWLSAYMLVVANVVPLFGILFFRWDAFQIVALYWVELVIFGLITILKIDACRPDSTEVNLSSMEEHERDAWRVVLDAQRRGPRSACYRYVSKLYELIAFVVPYAFCCFVLFMVTAYAFGAGEDIGEGDIKVTFRDLHEFHLSTLVWGTLSLGASHLYSYYRNYLGRGEYRRTVATILMVQAYGRAILLYIAILVGMWLSTLLGEGMGVLLVLIVVKTVADLKLHLRERDRNAATISTDKL